MSRNVIQDGYTRSGYVAAVEGLHESLAFKFRPMLPETVDAVGESLKSKSARDGNRVLAAAIVNQLVEWSEVDADGKSLAITIDTVRRLPWKLFNRLYSVVSGMGPSDPLPEAKPVEDQDFAAALIEAAETGKPFGLIDAERSEKN